ncbi:MAG: GNAT family N-acetyltransferase [Candidatus Bathyarchaeia archaeon]
MGSNFRRYFKRIERKMMESGGYEVISVNKFDNSVLEDIFYVERRSWKEKWRRQKGINADGELIKILEGIKEIDSEFSTFKWNIWLLKINGELASYALTIQFKDVGYVVKTSFNEKFRNYYPGTYLVNAAVRGFFERTAVKIIDFQTNLPFMEKWKPIIYPRTRIMMGQGSLFSSIANISTNKVFCILRDQLVGPFIAKLPYLPLSL